MDSEVGHNGGGHYCSQKCALQSLESSGLKNGDSVKIAPFLSGKEITSCSPSPEVFKAATAKKSLSPLASLRGCAPPCNEVPPSPVPSSAGGNSGWEKRKKSMPSPIPNFGLITSPALACSALHNKKK